LTIELDCLKHGAQADIANDGHRFKINVKGRRWGGSDLGVFTAAKVLLEKGPYSRAMWVTPIYDQGDECIMMVEEALRPQGLIVDWVRSKRYFRLYGGGLLYFRSTDKYQNLRSRGWDHINVSEAGYVPDDAWYKAMRPALMDREGTLYAEGSPNGAQGWFYSLYLRGQKPDSEEPDIRSWLYPTSTAPHIKPDEIADLERTMPTRVFRQEILAEFLTGASVVFGVIPVEEYDYQARAPKGAVTVGCDVAKLEDYTVLTALDEAGYLVGFKRINQIEYTQQAQIIAAFAAQWKAPVYLDATGVGEAVLDLLRGGGVDVVPFTFTHDSKRQLIENLVVTFEQQRITLPVDEPAELHSELKAYGARWTPAGVKYAAPPGHHDDCVSSLALAAWANRRVARPAYGWI